MKKIYNLVKESIWDYMKDNVKNIIIYVVALFVAVLPNFISQLNSIELKIRLPIIIIFITVLLVAIINIYIIRKRYIALNKEYNKLLNPPNENVKKFSLGDTVISKLDKESQNPDKMIVFKIQNSEIACRNINGVEKSYIPQELLTAYETSVILSKNESEKQRRINIQNQIQNEINSMYTWE